MKKVLALSVVALFCLAVAALAGDEKKMGEKKMGGKTQEGTITKVDSVNKTIEIKDSNGNQKLYSWTSETKTEGDEAKEGAVIHYKLSADGKNLTWFHVGEMKKT